MNGPAVLLTAATVCAGLQAGTYFTWSVGVMPGLARTSDVVFVDAMRSMNRAIVNPAFMITFLGAPVLAGAALIASRGAAKPWAIAATILAAGTVLITSVANVPLNNTLDSREPAPVIRSRFERAWVRWNWARTFTSAGALAALGAAASIDD